MFPRERVIAALNRQPIDRIPYCEHLVDVRVAANMVEGIEQLTDDALAIEMFYSEDPRTQFRTVFRVEPDISQAIGRDNVTFWESLFMFPDHNIYLLDPDQADLGYSADGAIKAWRDVDQLVLRELDDDFWQAARTLVENKGDFAACAIFYLGIDPMWHSMGYEHFAMSLFDDPALIEALMDRLTDWLAEMVEGLCALDFDFMWAADDIAHKTATMFSPQHYRDLLLPYQRKVAEKISKPWIFHSDGNLEPVLDDLLSLGMNAIHPLEPGAMDPVELKQRYGDRLALVGNIDVDLLASGTPAQVRQQVRERIAQLGPGYGYLLSSSNSITDYCLPENVWAMLEALEEYGRYPLFQKETKEMREMRG